MLRDELNNIKSSKKDLRNFGLTVGFALVALSGALYWFEKEFYLLYLVPGLVILICGFFTPSILKPLQKVWMSFSVLLGWFMTRIILGILFYFVVTLISYIYKISGKRFLDLKIEKSQNSYWNNRNVKKSEQYNYEKQY